MGIKLFDIENKTVFETEEFWAKVLYTEELLLFNVGCCKILNGH